MPRESDPSRFSVHNTRVERFVSGGRRWVEKTVRPSAWDRPPLEKVAALILDYRSRLLDAGIPMPDVVHWRIDGDAIVYRCEDGGANLVERHPDPAELVREDAPAVEAALAILRRASDAGLRIDPHVKNFVGEGAELRYVDFSPPLVSAYVEARCAAATPDEERILRENFLYFTPEHLPYHFAGDLLNVGPSAGALFPELHAMLDAAGMIAGVGAAEFEAHARTIRALEDLRLEKRIALF